MDETKNLKKRAGLLTDVGLKPALCVFFSSIWCLFTLHNRPQELSVSPSDNSFLYPPPTPSLHTCDLVNGSQSKKERKEEKKHPFLPRDDCRPHYRLFRGGGGGCLCYFFRKKELMLCAGAGRSWLSAVLGNHLSLY